MYSTSGPQQPLSNSKDEQSTTGGQVFCVPNHEWNRYKELASAAHKEGNLTQAEAMWLAALAEAKSFNAKDDRLAHTLDSLASFYYSIGRHEQAELFCKRALEVTTEAYGAYSIKVAACLNNLAGIYYNQRRYADAEPLCVRLISIYEYN
jgi:tetratricopeptide (TPR) repeat protein